MQVAVRLIRREEEGMASKHLDDIEEEDAEASDISWVQLTQVACETLLTMGCCSSCTHCGYTLQLHVSAWSCM